MAGPFLIHTTAPLKCPSDEKLYVKHVILEKGGQTHPIQRKEVKNCLMINQLLFDGGKQGKQILWKNLLMVEFSSYSEDEVSGILARNIEYNGSRYCFLGFSELQLKNKTCFLIAETDKQIGERRTTFANLSVTIPFADRVAKVQHMFEPYEKSLQLTEDEFIFENNADITEESGFMSPELAEKIKKTAEYSLAYDPSVVQVICPGFSGKLVLLVKYWYLKQLSMADYVFNLIDCYIISMATITSLKLCLASVRVFLKLRHGLCVLNFSLIFQICRLYSLSA